MPQVEASARKTNPTLVLGVCGGLAAMLIVLIGVVVIVMSRHNQVVEKNDTTSGFAAVKDKIALIKCREGSGTGFLLGMDGKTYLISNEHVVRSVGEIEARLIDGTVLQLGEFAVASDGRDLARFEVLNCKNTPLVLRTSMPSIGEQVTVYGNSLGGGVATESKGFIQGVGPKRIETNAEIVSGNSGSPLIDSDGKIVGVAAFIVGKHLIDEEDRFFNKDTRYADHVRRFAVRLSDVTWKVLRRDQYEAQVCALAEFTIYWEYLIPFLLFDSREVEVDKSKLVYNDFRGNKFRMSDTGFDEMLKTVTKVHERCGKSIRKLDELVRSRNDFVKRLNAAIDVKEMSKEDANKELTEYDSKMKDAYEKAKASSRDMILIRKEALNHAKAFLGGRTWDAPQIADGYDGESRGSVVAYHMFIKNAIALMNQKMKDLDKDIKEIEKGGDDDEN